MHGAISLGLMLRSERSKAKTRVNALWGAPQDEAEQGLHRHVAHPN